MAMPHQEAAFYLQLENTSPMETTAKIMDPKGRSSDIEVRDIGNNLYQITFKPEMDGSHAISVFNKGQHVLGELSYSFIQILISSFLQKIEDRKKSFWKILFNLQEVRFNLRLDI